ncbi:MAG TPA: 6-phosphogluconolactonase [Gemmatimonadaceae bacterium]|nr:6-phosphogluconolactonase [Gemmatimonadaceae bacterium]
MADLARRSAERELVVCDDLAKVSEAAAGEVARAAREAVKSRGRFAIALAGGGTPRALYRLLAARHRADLPWDATHVFFGDERCVPPDDAASNFGMARAELLSRVPIPVEQVHRIRGELPAGEAARLYDAELRRSFGGADAAPGAVATFDVALLGVGEDGHTASLFPGSEALEERARWAVAAEAPPGTEVRARVTVTLPVLRASRELCVLAAGEGKRGIVEEIFGGAPAPRDALPAALVAGTERTVWIIDRAAAGRFARAR